MAVMAAYVPRPVYRPIFQVIILSHRQRVYIRPQQDAGTSVSDHGGEPRCALHARESRFHIITGHLLRQRTAAFLPRDPHLVQSSPDIGAGLRQIRTDLRDLMERPPVSNDLILYFVCFLPDLFCRY